MIILALLIGIVAGMRSMMAPAAIAWAASGGRLGLTGSWLSFLGYRFTPWFLSLLAVGELVADQLPAIPSRKLPIPFAVRLLTGGMSGAAIGAAMDVWPVGLVLGLVGAVIGTFGGAALRGRMAAAFGNDRPAALLEDAVALLASAVVVLLL